MKQKVIAVIMSLTLLSLPVCTLSADAQSVTKFPSCVATNFKTQVQLSTRPGGSTAALLLSQVGSLGGCEWQSTATAQWGASGAGSIENPVSVSGINVNTTLGYGQQILLSFTTMEGVQCSVSEATAIRFKSGSTISIPLPHPLAVCASTTVKWSSASAHVVAVTPCTASQLQFSITGPSGAAGTSWYGLDWRNISSHQCDIGGTPVVQPMSGAQKIGPASRQEPLYGATMVLSPGANASAAYGVGDVGNYSTSLCGPSNAKVIQIVLGAWRKVAVLSLSTCTKLASTSVEGVVPGESGAI
jgi:hypothetical protein